MEVLELRRCKVVLDRLTLQETQLRRCKVVVKRLTTQEIQLRRCKVVLKRLTTQELRANLSKAHEGGNVQATDATSGHGKGSTTNWRPRTGKPRDYTAHPPRYGVGKCMPLLKAYMLSQPPPSSSPTILKRNTCNYQLMATTTKDPMNNEPVWIAELSAEDRPISRRREVEGNGGLTPRRTAKEESSSRDNEDDLPVASDSPYSSHSHSTEVISPQITTDFERTPSVESLNALILPVSITPVPCSSVPMQLGNDQISLIEPQAGPSNHENDQIDIFQGGTQEYLLAGLTGPSMEEIMGEDWPAMLDVLVDSEPFTASLEMIAADVFPGSDPRRLLGNGTEDLSQISSQWDQSPLPPLSILEPVAETNTSPVQLVATTTPKVSLSPPMNGFPSFKFSPIQLNDRFEFDDILIIDVGSDDELKFPPQPF